MEHKRRVTIKRRLSTHEEELIRAVDYDSSFEPNIVQKNRSDCTTANSIILSIAKPDVKTLFMSKKSFANNKDSEISTSQLSNGLDGDGPLYSNKYGDEPCSSVSLIKPSFNEGMQTHATFHSKRSRCTDLLKKPERFNDKRYKEICHMCNHTPLNMNSAKVNASKSGRIDKATLIVTNTSSEDSIHHYDNIINQLQRRIDDLERKVHKQEVVFRAIDASFTLLPSTEDIQGDSIHEIPITERPECSYIEQYNQMPETSGFQPNAQRTSSLPPNKASSVTREQNHEKYLRSFTTYDGITTRGRRCASVPLKKNIVASKAEDRVQKIRHKLNPVRDYKLMDTVHYLAQGEFAPRDDGIKLTPSREAVLSDIIWEDVCRTHWPSIRLTGRTGRRTTRQERMATRAELQRLVDNLLRERVTHAERRRRKQYRIIRLNQSTVGNVGKTGDIIVASNKNKHSKETTHVSESDHGTIMLTKSYSIDRPKVNDNSENRLHLSEACKQKRIITHEKRPPLANNAVCSPSNKHERITCSRRVACTSTRASRLTLPRTSESNFVQQTTCTNNIAPKPLVKNPRYIVKKDPYGIRHKTKESPGYEQYILLPTLVVRTPSNVRRQKKFNELYHRIINFHGCDSEQPPESSDDAKEPNYSKSAATPLKKDIGLNFNINLSDSERKLQ